MLAGWQSGSFLTSASRRTAPSTWDSSRPTTEIATLTGNPWPVHERLLPVQNDFKSLQSLPQEEQLMTPDFSLSGGVALVTGAGSGIGRAIALGLAGAGALVGCVDRVPGNVEAT